MTEMDAGMAGGIAGAVIGVMGGVLGTYASVRNATRPRERALTNRLAALGWTWMAAMAAWLILMPRPWNQEAILMNLPMLLAIPEGNRMVARARAEDGAGVR
jgi:hypothetical protein